MSGDWGGGMGLAQEAMWWSARAEDGRGPATALSAAVAAHFVLPSAMAVAESVHLHRIARERLHELVPLLFRVAGDGDPVARSIVERQAREVVSLASIALRRLRLDTVPADVVLGGGVLTAQDPLLMSAIRAGLAQEAPLSRVHVLSAPPLLGAILLGLEDMAAGRTTAVEEVAAAQERLRAQLDADAVLPGPGARVTAGDARVGLGGTSAGHRWCLPPPRHGDVTTAVDPPGHGGERVVLETRSTVEPVPCGCRVQVRDVGTRCADQTRSSSRMTAPGPGRARGGRSPSRR